MFKVKNVQVFNVQLLLYGLGMDENEAPANYRNSE